MIGQLPQAHKASLKLTFLKNCLLQSAEPLRWDHSFGKEFFQTTFSKNVEFSL